MLSIKTHDQLYPKLFEAVQLSGVYGDSKHFVDATSALTPKEVLDIYRKESSKADFKLADFVERYFQLPEIVGANYLECSSRPIREHIDDLWNVLARPADALDRHSSLIPLPQPYLVPGGRFREIYYWDSYFTMLGLVESGRVDTIQSMLDNFAHLIDQVGFIPNGNRSYFCSRSQPPVFALMLDLLAQISADASGVYRRYLPQLEKEYAFWMSGYDELSDNSDAKRRVVKVEGGYLNRYWDDSDEPRPESYLEDVELASQSKRDSKELYRDLRAACESGWDFTSRWFEQAGDISSIVTTKILPVDLNSLMYNLEKTLLKAYDVVGDSGQKKFLEAQCAFRKQAIEELFFDQEEGVFADLNIEGLEPTGVISMASAFPLFFNLATEPQAASVAKALKSRFLKQGGWVTTLNATSQQWDSPNGWAPLHWIGYQGLKNYRFDDDAAQGASAWVNNNIVVYQETGKLVEKYNVIDLGLAAKGGEYEVQHGFGWTNGVLLKLMNELGM